MPFVTEECDGGRIHIELSFFTSRKQVQKQNQIFRTEKKCWQVMAAFSNWSTHRTASKRARDENKNEVFYHRLYFARDLASSRRRVVEIGVSDIGHLIAKFRGLAKFSTWLISLF